MRRIVDFSATIDNNGKITVTTNEEVGWTCYAVGDVYFSKKCGVGSDTIETFAPFYQKYISGDAIFNFDGYDKPYILPIFAYQDDEEVPIPNKNYISVDTNFVEFNNHTQSGFMYVFYNEDNFTISYDEEKISVTQVVDDNPSYYALTTDSTDSFETDIVFENNYYTRLCVHVVYTYDYNYDYTEEEDSVIE